MHYDFFLFFYEFESITIGSVLVLLMCVRNLVILFVLFFSVCSV